LRGCAEIIVGPFLLLGIELLGLHRQEARDFVGANGGCDGEGCGNGDEGQKAFHCFLLCDF
jgi:hypothetical protein